jgi:integrase
LLKRSTVRNRLTYVTRFYEYAKAEGWIGSLPFGFESRTVRSRSSGTMRVRDVMPRAHKGLPQFLSKAEIAALLAATTNKHHGIILRLALGTGLRREELATFPARYVVDPDRSCTRNRNISVHLDPGDGSGMKTKGGRSRTIFMSRELMKDLHEYLALRRGERASLRKLRHHTLFLNQAGAPYGLDGKSLDRIVREIGAKVGLDVWTHKLRHSYATHTLAMLQSRRRENRVEPLVFLQRQLGHASIQSTLIYLHLIHELVDDAVIAYDAELDAFTGAAGG